MVYLKGLLTGTAIIFGLAPGIFDFLRSAINNYRTDVVDLENRVTDNTIESLYGCYDFIVIGAGSAGSVVANRLSEHADWNILIIEAGTDEDVLADIPMFFPAMQATSMAWKFNTEPDPGYCLSATNGTCKWPSGKVVGGSSSINAMLYTRGNRKDYDNWAAAGNPGWSYAEVLPYFKKSEDMRIPEYAKDTNNHGTGGYLTIENFKYEHPITRKLLEAGEELGYKIVDVNGDQQSGFMPSQATLRDGLRCSASKAFIRSASLRHNLHISMSSVVKQILICKKSKRAYGVLFEKDGETHKVLASKEVILSAGAIQSPQLLMLSGVGDADHLREVGIEPVQDLKGVGQNLQDHVGMGGQSFLVDDPYKNGTDICFNLDHVLSVKTTTDFTKSHNGEFYSMPSSEAVGFIKTKYANQEEDRPDIQLLLATLADGIDGELSVDHTSGPDDTSYAAFYEHVVFQPMYSVVPMLLQPKSRGYIKLKNAHHWSPPIIHPNYFADPQDMKILIEGARIANSISSTSVMLALNSRPNPRQNPSCKGRELLSDDYLECQARHHTVTLNQPVGTCAMGPQDDKRAVVSHTLKVHGIESLRVVDASVMPTIPSGNTNSPTIMIAEKASDMIKEDWAAGPYDKKNYCPAVQLKPRPRQKVECPKIPERVMEEGLFLSHLIQNYTSYVNHIVAKTNEKPLV